MRDDNDDDDDDNDDIYIYILESCVIIIIEKLIKRIRPSIIVPVHRDIINNINSNTA